MKIIYGTNNKAKLFSMQQMLYGLNIQIIGLESLNVEITDIVETGNSPIDNATQKAVSYYNILKQPVFSCDSALFLQGVQKNEQPSVYTRRVNNIKLSDEEMIEHYSNLAKKHGGQVYAYYQNAICLVLDEKTVISYQGDDINNVPFIICDKPHNMRNEGFPIDSLSIDIRTGKYFFDLDTTLQKDNQQLAKGLQNFFIKHLQI